MISNWVRNCQAALLSLIFVMVATGHAYSQDANSPKGMVILTIGGEISNTNRGPMNEKRDDFFKRKRINFDGAYQFDRTMLDQLKQGSVKVNMPLTGGPAVLKGPLLSEVFKLVGVKEGASIKTVALDGFTKQFGPEHLKEHDWILASTVDGKPLGIGAEGPVWMVFELSDPDASEKEKHHWPWSIFYIEVIK